MFVNNYIFQVIKRSLKRVMFLVSRKTSDYGGNKFALKIVYNLP